MTIVNALKSLAVGSPIVLLPVVGSAAEFVQRAAAITFSLQAAGRDNMGDLVFAPPDGAPRRRSGADSPTQVNLEGDSKAVARWIWNHLVPASGQAATVQGELLRAVEKLSWEAQNNGNGNWDIGFDRLLDFLRTTLTAERRLPPEIRRAVARDLDRLGKFQQPYLEDDLYDRLREAVVAFCRFNPVLVPRPRDPSLNR
jgi:hypothetical protein